MSDRLPRRRALSAGLRAAGVFLAAPVLAGCSVANLSALAGKSVTLSVLLLGGASGGRGPGATGILAPLSVPLQNAVKVAAQHVSGLARADFQTVNDPSGWFPPPTTLFNVGANQSARADDPSISMPDLVIAVHSEFPNYLANRALDLQPQVQISSSTLGQIPPQILRLGQAYGVGQGTFQASLPLVRVPLLCLVSGTVQAVTGTNTVWSASAFQQTLTTLAANYAPPSAALAPLPFPAGVAAMAALGSGGTLATSTSTACQGAFAGGSAAQGLATTVGWAQYGPQAGVGGARHFTYGALIWDGEAILQGGGAPPSFNRFAVGVGGTSSTGWSVVPVPAFPSRWVQPVRTIDVMVFRHTQHPTEAAALAVELLGSEAQTALSAYTGALCVQTSLAVGQLQRALGNVQGAELIASPAHDVTTADAYGVMTDQNMAAYQTVENDLMSALQALVPAGAGYWFDQYSPNGPSSGGFGRPGGFGGTQATNQPAPTSTTIDQILQQAQSAADAGKPFTLSGLG